MQITDQCGTSNDSVFITVNDCRCKIYVPNVFSPNQDQINDLFMPQASCAVASYTFTIYDRYGGRLFETQDWGQGWDGTVNGELA